MTNSNQSYIDKSLKPENMRQEVVNDILELHLRGRSFRQISEAVDIPEELCKSIVSNYW